MHGRKVANIVHVMLFTMHNLQGMLTSNVECIRLLLITSSNYDFTHIRGLLVGVYCNPTMLARA